MKRNEQKGRKNVNVQTKQKCQKVMQVEKIVITCMQCLLKRLRKEL